MIAVNVQGGTNAGRRRIRPTPQPWFCGCYELADGEPVKKLQRGSLVNCVDCKQRRPK